MPAETVPAENFQVINLSDIQEVLAQPESETKSETVTSDKVYKFMLGAFVALNVVDALTTLAGFKVAPGSGYSMVEWGPGMAPLIGILGVEAAMLVKSTIIAAGVVGGVEVGKSILSKYLEKNRFENPIGQNMTSVGLGLLNSAFLAVILSNIYQIAKVL